MLKFTETNTQNASEATPRSSGEGAGLKASNYENIPPNNPGIFS